MRFIGLLLLTCIPIMMDGEDIDVTADLPSGFWESNGEVYSIPLLNENGKLSIQQTKFILVTTELRREHVHDSHGKAYPHVHFKDDVANVTDANRYWDAQLGAPQETARISDATTRINGVAYNLSSLSAKGKYSHWIDNNQDAFQQAFVAEMTVDPKDIVSDPNADVTDSKEVVTDANALTEISFKIGCSGVYKAGMGTVDSRRVKSLPIQK